MNGICREATCGDGIKNQDETDVDCGGLNCSKCPDSRTCIRNDDCLSGYCYNGICRTPTCSDGIKNQDEEGIDCGGPCLPCEEEKPGLITQDLLAIGGIFLSLLLAIIIILVIAFKNKKRRRVVEKVMFKNRYDSHEKVQGYTPAYASGMQDPEQPEESPQGQGNAVSPDESIVKGYLKKLVEKLVSDGRGYYDIKSEIIKKGYTESKYLAFIKEEYMNNMIRQIKQDIESLKEKGFSDDQIKEYLIKSGFSENDIEKVFR